MSVRMRRRAAAAFVSSLSIWLVVQPLHAQQLPVLPPLEEEPLVQPPQVEAPPYPVEQLQPMAPEPRPAQLRPVALPPDEPVFAGGGVAIQGGLGSTQQILLSFNASSALFGLGLGFGYNQGGVGQGAVSMNPDGSINASTETISFQLAAYFAYMAYNTKPLAFGPEIDFDAQLAPGTPFQVSTLVPGFAVWYAPFPSAPLLIGTMLGLRIGFLGYGNPTVSTDYPGVRLRWGF
jgi:hypothetical protein